MIFLKTVINMVWILEIKNVVLIEPTKTKMNSLLCHVFNWTNKNEMPFGGINKYATMIIKPLNFVNYHGYENSAVYLWIYSIIKEYIYTYLIISFSNDL